MVVKYRLQSLKDGNRMLHKLKELAIRHKLSTLLERYHVELKHYMPGRVRVVIRNWRTNADQIMLFVEDLKKDSDVHSIEFTKETGSVLIHFNPDALENRQAMDRWMHIFNTYQF